MTDIGEVLRYLGAGRNAPDAPELKLLRRDVEKTAAELEKRIRPRYVYKIFPLRRENGKFYPGDTGMILAGRSAEIMLSQCGQVVLLLCTLGARFENIFRAAQARDMAKAVILDACGSALVEAGCDAAERELAARFPEKFLTDRFSPGYGDLELKLQKEICDLLDSARRLGVQVTESYMLNPSKSVTALIGIADRPQMARVRGCAYCTLRETCAIRKGGKNCGI